MRNNHRKIVWVLFTGILLATGSVHGVEIIRRLTDDAHVSGQKLTHKDLEGKVIFIEFWGLNCPPCRASLPKMQELHSKYGKRGNFIMLGSHCQGRDDESVKALLDKAGATYPVYQHLMVDGMPDFRTIPRAAIIDHKGKLVATGALGEVLAELPKVLRDAPVPIPGSLLGSTEIVHNKGVEKKLVLGQNVEPTLQQLKAKAEMDSDAGREAAAIVKAAESALTTREEEIRRQLEKEPSLAHASIAEFAKTSPSRAAQFSEDYKKLNANQDVAKLRLLRQELAKMEAQTPKNRIMAKTAVQQAVTKRRQFAALEESADPAVQNETRDLLASFDAMVDTWGKLAE